MEDAVEEEGGALPIGVGLDGARPSANKRGPCGGLKIVEEGAEVSTSSTDIWLSADDKVRSSAGFTVRSSNEKTDKTGGADASVATEGGALSLLLSKGPADLGTWRKFSGCC